jgi:hypothetical protein
MFPITIASGPKGRLHLVLVHYCKDQQSTIRIWNNRFKGDFIDSMGQGNIIMSTPRLEVKASGITEDSPLYHAINMFMSKFDELEGKMFGAPVAALPHDAYTSGSGPGC